jgi:uncharacterized membrane protein
MSGITFILALVAIVMALVAARSVSALQARLGEVLHRLRTLEAQVALARPAPSEAPSTHVRPAEAPPAEPPPSAQRAEVEGPAASDARPAVAPAAPAVEPQIPAATATLEEQFGTRWAVWVGGLALALGGVLLVLYSIEQGIFSPAVRVALGAVFSVALVTAGEWFRRSERASPVQGIPAAHIPGVLTAAGTVSAFGTAYAAHALYQFIGPAAAFVMLGSIAVATMLAAALHGPGLAGLGLAGALVVPLLIASHEPNPWPVVLYLVMVAGAAYALARLRRWLWLGASTVAGGVLWGFALLAPPAGVAPGAWQAALLVHTGLQLALAAAFMAIEPHLTTADPAAEPDWIATLALAALAVLAIQALAATRTHEQWALFAVAALAVLGATAWRSAPAAGAGVLAGILALAAIAVWPTLGAPPGPGLAPAPPAPGFPTFAAAPALEGILRLPENVTSFLAFAALTALSVSAAATLRAWHGRALPAPTAGLYALAGVVTPLLALVLAYLRVTQFDRSIPFALCAVFLAAALYLVADRFGRIAPEERTAATGLLLGAFASGVAAATALAFVMVLDRGYLTVAFAVTAFATAVVAVAGRIPLLRYVVVAIGIVVLGRLAWDPRIMGTDIGTWPVLNWLLLGYGVPALAFLAGGHILKREAEDLAARLCDGLGVLFAALLFFFQIRHALNGGDPFAPDSGHVEQGLFALTSLGFAAVLIRLDLARANPVFRAASLVFGVVAAVVILFGLGLGENPLFEGDPVRGPVVFSSLMLAYLLPSLAAVVLARIARRVRPAWYVTGAAALAVLLMFGYVTLEVRHAFQGERLLIGQSTGAPEVWSYSVAWLALGLAFLFYGLWRGSAEARLASAALVVLSVLKVFLYDLTGIGGFWRAFSVICLGAVLIGIGLVYQKLVFARPQAPSGP